MKCWVSNTNVNTLDWHHAMKFFSELIAWRNTLLPAKMSTSANKGGRQTDPFITAHLTKLWKHESSANKWLYQCNYCRKEMVHRDSVCLDHLVDGCPNVQQDVRVMALQKLARGNNTNDSSILQHTIVLKENNPTIQFTKKRKAEDAKVTTFMERPIGPEVVEDIDQRLLRWVHRKVQ